MCKKIIDLNIDNYRVEVDDYPQQYILQKRSIIKNKQNNVDEEIWSSIKWYSTLNQLVSKLSTLTTLVELEKEYENTELQKETNKEYHVTMRKYLNMINDAENEIRKMLNGN